MEVDKKLILNEIKKHLNFKKDKEFADFLEIKPQTLATWYSRNVYDIHLLYEKCNEISPDWLLTGKGSMLRGVGAVPLEEQAAIDEKAPLYEKIISMQEKEIQRLEAELQECQGQKKAVAHDVFTK